MHAAWGIIRSWKSQAKCCPQLVQRAQARGQLQLTSRLVVEQALGRRIEIVYILSLDSFAFCHRNGSSF